MNSSLVLFVSEVLAMYDKILFAFEDAESSILLFKYLTLNLNSE